MTDTMVTFKLNSTGKGVEQEIKPAGSAHIINVDAAPVFGGADKHPSPMAYVLGSLISCSQVTCQLVAKDMGVELGGFEFGMSADLDTDILVNGASDGNPIFQNVVVDVTVETDVADDVFNSFGDEVLRRCPVYQLFARSGATINYQWNKRDYS